MLPPRSGTCDMHALIIEQDAWVAFAIEDALRNIGYTSFSFAVSAQDAFAFARMRCPDLITSAIRLGEGSGIDTVRAICSERPVAVVVITSTSWEVREHAPDLPVVQKPFVQRDLEQAVSMAVSRVSAG